MTTVTLRGEGGFEFEFDLPLSEPYADQVKAGKLVPVDADSAAALEELTSAAAAADEAEPATDETKQLKKMKLAELLDHAAEAGVGEETLEALHKPGTSKAKVIAAIQAAETE